MDRAYDAEKIRAGLRAKGIQPLLAQRKHRARQRAREVAVVVERTFAWLNQFRRLRVRYEKRADIRWRRSCFLGCILICWRLLALKRVWDRG